MRNIGREWGGGGLFQGPTVPPLPTWSQGQHPSHRGPPCVKGKGAHCPTTLWNISVLFHPACHLLVRAWAKICFDYEHWRLVLEPTLAKVRACETQGQQEAHKSSATVSQGLGTVPHLSGSVEQNQEFISPISLGQGGYGLDYIPSAEEKRISPQLPHLSLSPSSFSMADQFATCQNSSDKNAFYGTRQTSHFSEFLRRINAKPYQVPPPQPYCALLEQDQAKVEVALSTCIHKTGMGETPA